MITLIIIIACVLVVLGNEGMRAYRWWTKPEPVEEEQAVVNVQEGTLQEVIDGVEPQVLGYKYKIKPHFGSDFYSCKVQVWTPAGNTLFTFDGELAKNKNDALHQARKAIRQHREGTEDGVL